ncbi:MAG: SDR family NAD(P)-dependent oxidoreductase, partial [Deltaproteobacteria bacterium]
MAWTEDSIPEQRGKTFVVTGANSGIGLEAAAVLAAKRAHVVLACRSPERAGKALVARRARVPGASVVVRARVLASLARGGGCAESCARA